MLAASYICMHRIYKENAGHDTGLAGAPVPHGWCVCPACTTIPACLVPGTCSVLAWGCSTEHNRAMQSPELKEDTSPGVAGGTQAPRGGPWSVCCCA